MSLPPAESGFVTCFSESHNNVRYMTPEEMVQAMPRVPLALAQDFLEFFRVIGDPDSPLFEARKKAQQENRPFTVAVFGYVEKHELPASMRDRPAPPLESVTVYRRRPTPLE